MKILDVPRSGSYQGITSSRNRFGQYVRTRATPVNPASEAQLAIRADFGGNASAWRALTPTQQAGWASLGEQIVRTDSLGQAYTLTGFAAFISVNTARLSVGDSVLDDAPFLAPPEALTSISASIGPASASVTFTPTPLTAEERAIILVSPQRSAGRMYEGDLRVLLATTTAGASPVDILSAYSARFGTPVVGAKIFVGGQKYNNGFLSPMLMTSAIVA